MKVRSVRERDRLKVGSAEHELPEKYMPALALAALDPAISRSFWWEHQGIRFGSHCGVLCIADLTIEILPKVSTKMGGEEQSRGVLISMLRDVGSCSLHRLGPGTLGHRSSTCSTSSSSIFVRVYNRCFGVVQSARTSLKRIIS